jgi:hypothetical protein
MPKVKTIRHPASSRIPPVQLVPHYLSPEEDHERIKRLAFKILVILENSRKAKRGGPKLKELLDPGLPEGLFESNFEKTLGI